MLRSTSSLSFDSAQLGSKLRLRPPKGVTFKVRAVWENEWTSAFIKLRGLELAGEFDVSKGKHMDIGWRKVRQAMCRKLGESAPWFIRGGPLFDEFCVEHNVDKDAYLEEVFKAKGTEKWKYLQEVYKEKKRRTVTTVDEEGNVVTKQANCTGEQQLDDIDWIFFDEMQQVLRNKPSVCPPAGIVLQTRAPFDNSDKAPMGGVHGDGQDDAPFTDILSNDASPTTYKTCENERNKRSARDDEADSPQRPQMPTSKKGRRPSSADRRHEEMLSSMLEQSSTVNETLGTIKTSITEMHKQLQTSDSEKLVIERAQKIQRDWDELFAFYCTQQVPHDVIIQQLGPRPSKAEAIQEALSWQESLRQTCQP